MHHYIYYSYEEKGRGYIGSRSCDCKPEKDPYFGSFKDKTFKPTKKIILAECKTKEDRYALEFFYQKLYNVVENPHFANRAFQTTSGFSRLGLPNSKESREKMSASRRNRPSGMKGKKHSEKTKEQISNSLRGKPCPTRSNKWTEERKLKHSQILKGRKGKKHAPEIIEKIKAKVSKEITLKNLISGELYSFVSGVEAAKFLNVNVGAIGNLRTKRNSRIREWVIADKDGNPVISGVSLERKTKPVSLMNVETKEIVNFKSVKEAAKTLNVWASTISKIMRGRQLAGYINASDPIDPL